ncbi:MAG TPA: hypothetical protein DDW50_12580 [Firmicutes bacterium]|jgi:ABC-type transporter Mla subunit MlaD|nr:hypothetical protein [Bacillota bacterium]
MIQSDLVELKNNLPDLEDFTIYKIAALNDITTHSNKVSELMDEIAAASQEHVQGVEQISKAVNQMETVTQQNAASAEESASAAEELNAQADSLRKIVQELSELTTGTANVFTDNLMGLRHQIGQVNHNDKTRQDHTCMGKEQQSHLLSNKTDKKPFHNHLESAQ